ncbi:cyclin-dependent kinase inhibitor 1-like isoform X2 [Solanum dulcamara]|uniref:cyclin-dependent kinase inhibitor 1-like isoform X2 n=1 Tax=Solanum dulcamara TaxID=45834 RepID=UPI0024861333|nr:cyclin-dependent kinase inhibitor 1-like isoform X2 [Solanum dulcamara]
MGSYMSKCKTIGEVTIMEFSDMNVQSTTKKRKMCDGHRDVKFSPALLRLTGHNGVADTPPESLVSPAANSVNSKENYEPYGSSTSCCSSNGSSNSKFLDLDDNGVEVAEKEKSSSSNERQEESGELESKKMPSHDDENFSPKKIPSSKEIEEFFTRCEKKLLKRFQEKYNFDFEKEEPLEGRYKWVQT